VSTPKKGDWYGDQRIRVPRQNGNRTDYNYYHHESAGAGQYVYIVEDGIWESHPEFQGALIEHRPGADYANDDHVADLQHGSGAASKIVGRNLGIAKQATAVILDKKLQEDSLTATVSKGESVVWEKFLESLLNAADDIATKGRSGRSVVSMSFGWRRSQQPEPFHDMMGEPRPLPILVLVHVLTDSWVCSPQSPSFKNSTNLTRLL
jgi:hypothetical protein